MDSKQKPSVNVAQAMHGEIVAVAASRNQLILAADRVVKAKAHAEDLSTAIRVEEMRSRDLKAQRALAVDELEAAVQAHDIAVRADQAARAVPAE
jgi:hypothetical protein